MLPKNGVKRRWLSYNPIDQRKAICADYERKCASIKKIKESNFFGSINVLLRGGWGGGGGGGVHNRKP